MVGLGHATCGELVSSLRASFVAIVFVIAPKRIHHPHLFTPSPYHAFIFINVATATVLTVLTTMMTTTVLAMMMQMPLSMAVTMALTLAMVMMMVVAVVVVVVMTMDSEFIRL